MKQTLKWAASAVSLCCAVSALVAIADGYEWQTKVSGVDVELKGNEAQVKNHRYQKDCAKMASYAIQQFQANGGVIDTNSHQAECQIGPDGKVSVLLDRNTSCERAACKQQLPDGTYRIVPSTSSNTTIITPSNSSTTIVRPSSSSVAIPIEQKSDISTP